MARGAVLALALLLLVPLAAAGSEASPEVSDGRDQSKATIDLLALWVESDRDGVRFTMKLATVDESPRGLTYAMGFVVNDGSRRVASIVFDEEGRPHSIVERVGYGPDYPTLDSYPDTVEDVTVRAGSPGYVSGLVPWGASPGLQPGATMQVLYALTDDGRTSDGRDYVDIGGSEARVVLERPPLAPGIVAAYVAGGLLAAGALVGVAVAFVVRRRREAREGSEASVAQVNAPAASAGGPRFRLDPRGPR